jgi:N6-adenosine-specific RNA methylase IME4
MELVKWEKAKFEKNSLILNDNITIEEWKELGGQLKKIEGCVQFWIGDWARFGDKKGFTEKYTDSKVYDELEEITGLERKAIQNIKSITDNIDSSRRREDLSFSHHAEVAKLNPEKQTEFLQKASEEKLSVRELRNLIKQEERNNIQQPQFPNNKYQVIYADPPWAYNDKCENGAIQSRGANEVYPTMSIDEICTLPIEELSQENAVLFMWITSPLLEDGFCVINSWGFEYKASFIWDKIKHNMGHYNSVRHEFLLIAVKGSCTPDNIKLFDSVLSVEKTEHSKKPEEFYNIIETLYSGKKIELFARNKRVGWDCWGNDDVLL